MQKAEEVYRQNKPTYNFAGGFLQDADEALDTGRKDFRVSEKINRFHFKPTAAAPPDVCADCKGILYPDSFIWQKFNSPVCNKCSDTERNGKYKLISRTEAKITYGLKDCDLDFRKPPLNYISKKNPHNPRYGDMKLYLKNQLEERMLTIYGSWEKLEETKELRRKNRDSMNERRFEKKLKQLRKDVQENSYDLMSGSKRARHDHNYIESEEKDEKTGKFTKQCLTCGYVLHFEKL